MALLDEYAIDWVKNLGTWFTVLVIKRTLQLRKCFSYSIYKVCILNNVAVLQHSSIYPCKTVSGLPIYDLQVPKYITKSFCVPFPISEIIPFLIWDLYDSFALSGLHYDVSFTMKQGIPLMWFRVKRHINTTLQMLTAF